MGLGSSGRHSEAWQDEGDDAARGGRPVAAKPARARHGAAASAVGAAGRGKKKRTSKQGKQPADPTPRLGPRRLASGQSVAHSQKRSRMAAKEKLEAVLNVALRVPSIMLLDVLYRWDVSSFFQQIQRSSLNNNPLFQYKYLALNMHYVGYILSVVLLTLPRQHLVQLYLYFLTALLLYAGHQISRDYVRSELESGYEGPMYLEPLSMNRFMTALIGQLVVCTLCSCVMKTKQIWLFSAHMLPLLARLCLVPLETIIIINKFAMIFTGLEVLYFLASNLLVPYNLAKSAYRELVQVVEVYGLLALGMSLWNQLVVPVLFMVFWLVLFALQIYSYFSTRDQPASRERLLFLFLTSIAECCSTPYSLLGLVFTVSFVALGVLTLCKFYLQGYRAFMNDPAMNRGMTEGVTLLILAVQTGLIELQVVHRAFLLSIILFIVVASILQSMLEIADPIVLALGASRDKSLWKHFRAVSLCLFLLVFPAYMAYMICQFFHMDFWLLIIISSSILTSLQVLGTLFIYVLFMVEEFRKEPVENMDDVIYYVNGTYRLLEFLVALCVVAYGVSETIFGEWTVMGSMIIFIHSYYNVWLRAQLGWKSFLLRRDAVNKIKSLPTATKDQLEQHNDICAICYQDMKSAVITPCGHFFHAGCLKKWLYVQETCPLCHCQLKNPTQSPGLGSELVPQPDPGAEQNTIQQEATETPGVEQQKRVRDKPIDNGQTFKSFSTLQDSLDTKDEPVTPDNAFACEVNQAGSAMEGMTKEQEEAVTRGLGGCIQN
ncbi:RING finger protein 145 isoform X2 [Paroedura picta]|uniref:RING finger protein 145 isoform X2 n=1 Tax=Paroedura picta TaxID=143630 RepID=UPI004057BC35